MGDPLFKVGDVVHRANDPEQSGVVVSARWNAQSEGWHYVVQFGARQKSMPEGVLRRVDAHASPWDLVAEGSCAGHRQFVSALTYHRLHRPPSRIAFSFATAKTQFFPHQFKPLLKFLDHPSKRILIADDVGLGKTIEAGYILRELRARTTINRVLVLVPARLTTKWKRELESRFDEHFEIVRRQQLLELAQRIERGKEPEPFRWITSYESARAEEVIEALERVDPGIELLIADEAHRMRNSEALQHQIGAVLSRSADMAVFLSATPVQNSLDDLWNLLRLLSPEEFGDRATFSQQMEANRPILAAQRALTEQTPDWGAASAALDAFAQSMAGRHAVGGALWQSISERLRARSTARRELVALQADVSRLSPTSHVLSRTRKAEAMVHRAQRQAQWVPVTLTKQEMEIYRQVEELCRLVSGRSWGNEMAVLMAYRMTASCIPAAMQYFADRLSTGPSEPMESVIEEEAPEARVETVAAVPADIAQWDAPMRSSLLGLAKSYLSGETTDSKLTVFVDALAKIWETDRAAGRPPRKVVVFSFFRRTLEYLRAALDDRKITNRMMHGGVPVLERDALIEEFLERPEVRVLLTSDVGGEGLDLQRAAVLFNYDLPWNPMVVEQRIGRIDRIGQESERIVIGNIIAAGSIEERILRRLLDKIGIFEESIGEIDPIIGEKVEKLTEQAVSGQLSPSQLEDALKEQGDALERRVHEARTVLSKVDGLLAADQALVDEIDSVVGERQIPSEPELLNFVNECLEAGSFGVQLPEQLVSKVVEVDLRGALPTAVDSWALKEGVPAAAFTRRAGAGPMHLTVSREAALRHHGAELLHLNHPLVRFSIDARRTAEDRSQPSFSLRLAKSSVLPSGTYLFLMNLLEIGGNRERTQFATVLSNMEGSRVWADPDETARVTLELLEKATDAAPPAITDVQLGVVRPRLESETDRLVADLSTRETRIDRVRVEQRMAALRTIADLKVERARAQVESLQRKGAKPFPVRMAEKKLEKLMAEQKGLTEQSPELAPVHVEQEAIAVGVLVVGASA